MNKVGFTLAEILITLGIIGVVAALTTPALYHNVNTADIGPKLAKFRSTVENANRMLMVNREVNRLSVLLRNANVGNNRTTEYTNLLQNFMRLDGGAEAISGIKTYAGEDIISVNVNLFENDTDQTGATANQVQVDLDGNAFTWRTSEGMAVHFFIAPPARNGRRNREPDNLGVILVDINANDGQNRLGRDIFGFVLGNNGVLTPIGSRTLQSYPLGDDDPDFTSDSQIWSLSCTEEGVTSQGLTCTGSIFANDLKVVYQ